jgi:hypothetical protein
MSMSEASVIASFLSTAPIQAAITVNRATEKGGGIFNEGEVTGNRSIVFANVAKKSAGIFNESGTVTLRESFVQP